MERQLYLDGLQKRCLTAFFRDRAHIPLIEKASTDSRVRSGLYAMALYYEGANFHEVGDMLNPPVSHETARQRIVKTFRLLWEGSSEKTKENYPLGAVPYQRIQNHRKDLGETTMDILDAVKEGGSFDEIAERSGVEGRVVTSRRQTLRNKGVEVPYRHLSPEQYNHLVSVCSDPNIPREEYLKIIPQITRTTAQHMVYTTDAMLSLSSALEECGYFLRTRKLAPIRDCLLDAGLVFHFEKIVRSGPHEGQVQHYYFAPRRDLELISTELMGRADFDKFRHIQAITA